MDTSTPPMTPDRLGEYTIVVMVSLAVLGILLALGFGLRYGMRCQDSVRPVASAGSLGVLCDRGGHLTFEDSPQGRLVVCRCR